MLVLIERIYANFKPIFSFNFCQLIISAFPLSDTRKDYNSYISVTAINIENNLLTESMKCMMVLTDEDSDV